MTKTAAQKAMEKLATKERIMIAGADGIMIDYVDDPEHDFKSKEKPKIIETVRFLDSNPFLKLFTRKSISNQQFKAGILFEEDWYYGKLEANMVKTLAPIMIDEGDRPTDIGIDRLIYHKKRYFDACEYVRSKTILTTIECCVLHSMKPSEIAKNYISARNNDRGVAIVIDRLKTGLDLLIENYEVEPI